MPRIQSTGASKPAAQKKHDKGESKAAKSKEEKATKKRTTNPGVRIQGGRIYDSESGTTCHQCRQKTVEVKAKCTECTLYWCPRCLLNRYGQKVEEVSKLKKWGCPRCEGACNCSNCRKKRGLEATGILANVCKTAGFGSVSDLLQKNPTAKRAILDVPKEEATVKAAKVAGKKRLREDKDVQEAEGTELTPDDELEERTEPFPAGEEVYIYFNKGSKRMRGVEYPKPLQEQHQLPDSCNPGDLAELFEFVHVFGDKLGTKNVDLSILGAELLQAPGSKSCFAEEDNSPVGKLHVRLLDLVRQDWGLRGSVGIRGWQSVMRQYLKHEQEQAQGLKTPFQSPLSKQADDLTTDDLTTEGEAAEPTDKEEEAENLPAYPDGGYWSLDAAVRLRMLLALMHDTLATSPIREIMEAVFAESAAAQKEEREEQAAARRKAREEQQEEKNRRIAQLIVGNGGLTLEEQRAFMAQVKMPAGEEVARGDSEEAASSCLRNVPLGRDRDGRLVWKLETAAHLTGSKDGLLVAKPWQSVKTDQWAAHKHFEPIMAALDERGQSESRLRAQLQKLFDAEPKSGTCKATATGKAKKPKQAKGCKAKSSQPATEVAVSAG